MRTRFLTGGALLAALLATAACDSISMDTTNGESARDAAEADALQGAVREEPVRRFYEARQWHMVWTGENSERLMSVLREAGRHGLDPATFIRDIDAATAPIDREVAMSRAALQYADALARGRTDPARGVEAYTVPRPEVDIPAGLAAAMDEDFTAWIEGLAPQDEEYRALSQAYLEARQQLAAAQQSPAQGNQQAATDARGEAQWRAVQLAVNLERRRWLERQPAGTRIDVNTAAAFLRYHRDGSLADQRVVVTGEPGWETPELGSPLFRLVANPDWTVPASIEDAELGSLSPAALERRNMRRENGRIVQQPGPDNALGLVKFDMRNDHAIYLHDTPSKAAFGRPERHLSHGCVRVNDALGFARMIAEHQGRLDEFNRALATRETTFVDLPQAIPVRLLYQTVFMDGGRLNFAPDIYGWDARVAQALGLPVPERPARADRQRGGSDVGP